MSCFWKTIRTSRKCVAYLRASYDIFLFYSSVYCGLPQVRLQPLDGVLRAAARMIGGVPRFGHISEFMRDTLHWLPVRQRIHYRLSTIVWRCVLGIAPTYL